MTQLGSTVSIELRSRCDQGYPHSRPVVST